MRRCSENCPVFICRMGMLFLPKQGTSSSLKSALRAFGKQTSSQACLYLLTNLQHFDHSRHSGPGRLQGNVGDRFFKAQSSCTAECYSFQCSGIRPDRYKRKEGFDNSGRQMTAVTNNRFETTKLVNGLQTKAMDAFKRFVEVFMLDEEMEWRIN